MSDNKCNFKHCKYYHDGICIDKESRAECVDIANAVLCIETEKKMNNGKVISMEMTYENSVKGRIKKAVINNADLIAKALLEGKDVEIRKTANGISVSKFRKTIIVR